MILTVLQQIIHNTFKPYYQPGQNQAPTNLIPSLIHRFHSKEGTSKTLASPHPKSKEPSQLTSTPGYTLYPDVIPLLKQLKAKQHQPDAGRVVIGIITNSDNRTADILTSMGVRVNPWHYGDQPSHSSAAQSADAQFDIDFTVLSYDVGFEKPDARIFAAAEQMLASLLSAEPQQQRRVDPDEWSKVYVGDEYEKDVVGATQAGWKAVLVDRETAGQHEGVEWLHGDEPASVMAVLARTKAVGFSSLKQFGEWLPSRE